MPRVLPYRIRVFPLVRGFSCISTVGLSSGWDVLQISWNRGCGSHHTSTRRRGVASGMLSGIQTINPFNYPTINTYCRFPPAAPTPQMALPQWLTPPSPCASDSRPYEIHPRRRFSLRRCNHQSVSGLYSLGSGERQRHNKQPGFGKSQECNYIKKIEHKTSE